MDEKELAQLAVIEDNHWWFVERRNLLRLWAACVPTNSKVVDIGAGVGKQSLLLKNEFGFDVIAVEQSEYGSNQCNKNGILTLQESATNLSLSDEIFDGVIAMDVLEHIKNDSKALAEISRVLKTDGKIFITVPAFQFMWSRHDEAVDHFRRYSKNEIRIKLETNGFNVIKIRYWNSLLFPFTLVRRLFNLGKSDLAMPGKLLNFLFGTIVAQERKNKIISKFPGTSIIILAEKVF